MFQGKNRRTVSEIAHASRKSRPSGTARAGAAHSGSSAAAPLGAFAGIQQAVGNRGLLQLMRSRGRRVDPETPGEGRRRVVQMAAAVPVNADMKVGDIRDKLNELIQETNARMGKLKSMHTIVAESFKAIDNPRGVQPDRDLKIAALELYIESLQSRIDTLSGKLDGLKGRNRSERMVFDFGVDELPELLNADHLIATDKELEKLKEWFQPEKVSGRKQNHRIAGEKTPGVTPSVLTPDRVDEFIRLPAAPLLNVDFNDLIQKGGGYSGCEYQGIHGNNEGNIPPPKAHPVEPLIELSVGIGMLDGGRAVVDVDSGRIYITEHYGQNLIKRILPLAQKTVRTDAENQELHALLFLKKLVNDFVLVTNVPGGIEAEMMDIACEAYLQSHLPYKPQEAPPAGTRLQRWCMARSSDILRRLQGHMPKGEREGWRKWRTYLGR